MTLTITLPYMSVPETGEGSKIGVVEQSLDVYSLQNPEEVEIELGSGRTTLERIRSMEHPAVKKNRVGG